MTTTVKTADGATRTPQLGSFTVVERLPRPDGAKGHVTLRVAGRAGTPVSDQEGLATCIAAPTDERAQEVAAALAAKLEGFRHPSLISVLEARLAGNVMYWVAPTNVGAPLPALSAQSPMPISAVVSIMEAAAAGLQAAHDAGLSHGTLTIDSIVQPQPGSYAVAGLGLVGRGSAQDQRDLGAIVIGLLAGRRWEDEAPNAEATIDERLARAQRLREQLSSVTERVVTVLLRAVEPDPADRFVSVAEFAGQFAEAVRFSGEDLVQAAFESISARNVELARLLAARAALYGPATEGLTLLNLQLQGGSPFGSSSVEASVSPRPQMPVSRAVPDTTPAGEGASAIPAELTEGLPPEFLEVIASQFEVQASKRGMHPMFVLTVGSVVVVFLLLVAALGTMLLAGS